MSTFLRRFPLAGGLFLIALFWASLLGVSTADAAIITVTTTADNGTGSLRQALADANDGDTIQFDPALNGQTISLTTGELVINKNITISGPGPSLLAVSRSGPSAFRIFHVLSGHTLVVEGLTITGGDVHNNTIGCGGGIFNDGATSTISNCTISGSFGFHGGGICSEDGSLTIAHSSIDSNHAGSGSSGGSGGGIYHSGGNLQLIGSTVTNNTGINNGGGVMSDSGTITIIDSTITSNTTLLGGGIEIGGFFGGTGNVRNSTINSNTAAAGGGIGTSSGAALTISNSTVSGNFASTGGGGIYNLHALTIVSVAYSTIVGNGTNGNGGGIYNDGTFEVGNTILNSGANIFNNSGGTITSHGYNLSSDNGGGFLTGPGDQINTNPLVGPLQSNGGPTFTHALLPGSPAINAGDPNFTPPPSTDQRGYPRVSNARIDIGSFEVQSNPTPTPTPCGTAGPGDAGGGQTGAPDLVGMFGTVVYCSNPVPAPVPGVTILLNYQPYGTTGSNGQYGIVLKAGCNTCRVTPSIADRTPGSPGIDTMDVIAVIRHFLIRPPLSGCRLTAADVNGDASINTIDIIAIQRFVLGFSTGIANVGKYRFNPHSRCFIQGSNQDFDTLVFGDVAAPFIY